MVIVAVTTFLFGFLSGGFIGVLALALGVMAKRNVEDMPETPMGATYESISLRLKA